MDQKIVLHAVTETIVIGGVVFWSQSKFKKLEEENKILIQRLEQIEKFLMMITNGNLPPPHPHQHNEKSQPQHNEKSQPQQNEKSQPQYNNEKSQQTNWNSPSIPEPSEENSFDEEEIERALQEELEKEQNKNSGTNIINHENDIPDELEISFEEE